MDMIERRMSMYMRENEEEEEMKWETLIDYTTTEELAVTDTYHEITNLENTFFQKLQNAKKIIIFLEFKSPSTKTQDALGDIKIATYSTQGWYPLTIVTGNYLPNEISGYASESMYYKEIDLTSVCRLGHSALLGVYTPSIFCVKNGSLTKKDETFGYSNMYNGTATLRVINKKVPVGKGSRFRVLVAS